MYITNDTLDWGWLDNQAASCLATYILELKDNIHWRQKDLKRLIDQTDSWKRREKYRNERDRLAGGLQQLDHIHQFIMKVHHDNHCTNITESNIVGTKANDNFNPGGTS